MPIITNNNIISTEQHGGVEEKKEDDPILLTPDGEPTILKQQPSAAAAAAAAENDFDEQRDGFQAQVENFATRIFGSCGTVFTSIIHGDGGCRWPTSRNHSNNNRPDNDISPCNFHNYNNNNIPGNNKPQLSITDELRKLAAKEGRVFGGGMRRTDIPRFLGEEAVYSFDDDNISAISQNTLEEMAKHGIKKPVYRRRASIDSLEVSDNTTTNQQQQQYPGRTRTSDTDSTPPTPRRRSSMDHIMKGVA